MLNHCDRSTVRINLAEETEFHGRSEVFDEVQLAGELQQGRTFMFELGNSDTNMGRD